MSRLVLISSILLSILLFSQKVIAQAVISENNIDYSSVRLNEIMPNPEGSDTDYEWIELYNSSDEEISLINCKIDDKLIEEDIVVGSQGYLVLAKDVLDKDNDSQSFEERWGDDSGVWGDAEIEEYEVAEINISLKNYKDVVNFECNDYLDSFEWSNSQSGVSFSVSSDDEWTEEYLVTPGEKNKEVMKTKYLHTVQISEVYPSPDSKTDEFEWVEFYNYGDKTISLFDWILEDHTKQQTISFDLKIKPKKHVILKDEDLKISLNNSGETLKLVDPNDKVVDMFEFEETDKGTSNIRRFGKNKYNYKVFLSKVMTPGKKNKYVSIFDMFYGADLYDISDIRLCDIGTYGVIRGYVTVAIDKLGSKTFYLEDGSGGVQVYLQKDEFWKDYKLFDELKLFGELKESYGEKRLYVGSENSIEKVGSEERQPVTVIIEEITSEYVGRLVRINGQITETSGSSFYVDDGTEKVRVYVKSSTGIKTPKKKKGQYALITGIVSADRSKESFRLLPRVDDDIVISDYPIDEKSVLAVTGKSMGFLLSTGILIASIGLITPLIRSVSIKNLKA